MLTRYTQKDLTWIDLVAPTPLEVRELMQEFGLNPLLAQELLSASTKSKVERYDDSVYATLHFPFLRGKELSRSTQEVDFIIGKQYLITTRYETIAPLHSFARAFEVEGVLGAQGHLHGGHLFAALLRNLYRALYTECDVIRGHLFNIEEKLFLGEEMRVVMELSELGKTIYDFRQALVPHLEMLTSLEAPLERMMGHEFGYYMRGVISEYSRLKEEIDNLKDEMVELRETNNSLLNAKQNEVMKNFSVLAFVFVPISIIMSLYQMNLPGTPLSGHINFWEVLGAVLLISVVLFIYFRRKGWL